MILTCYCGGFFFFYLKLISKAKEECAFVDLNSSRTDVCFYAFCLELRKAIIVNCKGDLDIHMVDTGTAFSPDASWGEEVEGGN